MVISTKIKVLHLQGFENSSDELPTSFYQRFTNLEKLTVSCSCFEGFSHREHAETNKKMKTLKLHSLWYLENICQEKSHMAQILQNLETLEVIDCSSLKTIAPSFVLFQNLDILMVNKCAALIHIISSSTARSLTRLRFLSIYGCEMLDEIMVYEDDDACEISFMKLEGLALVGLPRLSSFCNGNLVLKFPLLQTLLVVECPMMETFSLGILSAPMLKFVRLTKEGDEWRWDGDLNTTISKVFGQSHSEVVCA